MADYVKQHIVPKRYLDRFTFYKSGKPSLGVRIIDKGKVKYFTRPPGDVGFIKRFYDVTDKEDPKYWEHYLDDEFDKLYGKPLEKIIAGITLSNFNYCLSVEDKELLTKIIISQMFRIPSTYSKYKDDLEKSLKEYSKRFLSRYPKHDRELLTGEVNKVHKNKNWKNEVILETMLNPDLIEWCCNHIVNNIWLVLYNFSNVPFATSDKRQTDFSKISSI